MKDICRDNITTKDLADIGKVLDKAKIKKPRWIILNGRFVYLNFWLRIKLFFKGVKIIDCD